MERKINTLNQFQESFGAWKKAVTPPQLYTPQRENARALQEEAELSFELAVYDGSPESRQKVAEEAVDVIFGKMGVIESVGFSLSELVNNKMEIILKKYPTEKVAKYRAQGMTHEQVMDACKKEWDAEHKVEPQTRGKPVEQPKTKRARKYWVI